jgi:hypothetical protein
VKLISITPSFAAAHDDPYIAKNHVPTRRVDGIRVAGSTYRPEA